MPSGDTFEPSSPQEKDDEGANGAASSVVQTAHKLEHKLDTDPSFATVYGTTTRQVIGVLRHWDKQFARRVDMSSFLRTEPKLLHESEECIVALHHFCVWWEKRAARQRTTTPKQPLTVVDVGCGKGYFSMFLSYLVGSSSKGKTAMNLPIQSIILIDKTSRNEINWSHIDIANATAATEGRPRLELWDATNLHHYDELLDRLLQKGHGTTLALTGIHLCKMLSPALISLVNGLGDRCHYACLAPCCLPRAVTKGTCRLSIYQYETSEVRRRRLERKAQRAAARSCAWCGSTQHLVRDCPEVAPPSRDNSNKQSSNNNDHDERSQTLQSAMKTLPCWKCGTVGHFAAACPLTDKPRATPRARQFVVPSFPTADNNNPFDTYCTVLAQTFQGKNTTIFHAGLVSDRVHDQKDDDNWNGKRKSVFLIATAAED